MPRCRRMRQTWCSLTSCKAVASNLPFHCANPLGGGSSSSASTRFSVCSEYLRGLPDRGASDRPARRFWAKRWLPLGNPRRPGVEPFGDLLHGQPLVREQNHTRALHQTLLRGRLPGPLAERFLFVGGEVNLGWASGHAQV